MKPIVTTDSWTPLMIVLLLSSSYMCLISYTCNSNIQKKKFICFNDTKHAEKCDQYSMISLTSCAHKIIMHIVNRSIQEELGADQTGFRKREHGWEKQYHHYRQRTEEK